MGRFRCSMSAGTLWKTGEKISNGRAAAVGVHCLLFTLMVGGGRQGIEHEFVACGGRRTHP